MESFVAYDNPKIKSMKQVTLVLTTFIISGIFLSGCNTKDRSLFLTTTITHSAIDWSEDGSVPADYNNADGETIGWCSMGTQIPGVTGIWYRNNTNNEVMYNLGNVDLSSVTSFDANLADSDICDSPMVVGDVWVIDCLDGYVKFKVTSVEGLNSVDWGVGVEYEFSSSGDFSS